MSQALIDHVTEYGLRETYASYAAMFKIPKTAVYKALKDAGLSPGAGRSIPKPITIPDTPWGDI